MKSTLVLLFVLLNSIPLFGEKLEVVHWWTSGGEAKSVDTLKKMFSKSGHKWQDAKISGGGGENANKAIKQRISTGDAPGVVQLKSAAIPQWGALGALESVDATAKSQKWDKVLPAEISKVHKFNGKFVSAPVNVHRINWMWANKAVLKKAGVKAPKSMDELLTALEKIKKSGVLPIAHGGQAWQDATVFESVILSVAGSDIYRKVFVDLDTAAAKSPKMLKAFKYMRKLTQFMSKDRKGLDWDKATDLVIAGKAGMQFMGDWAKGEFVSKNKKPGKDFVCAPFPGSEKAFIYNIDAFGFLKTKGGKSKKAQYKLAELILDKKFQAEFNKRKGSIPVRTDMDMSSFDSCAQLSAKQFSSSSKKGSLVPSLAHGMAQAGDVQGPFVELMEAFINSDMSPEQGVKKLVAAIEENE